MRRLLAHPLTRGADLDSPQTTGLRKQIIAQKSFLRKIYLEWYELLLAEIPANVKGETLELGSGAGFFGDIAGKVLTSDIFSVPGLSLVLDAHKLPFKAKSLKAILMTNVLHHLPDPARVFGEALRCLAPGGKIAMIEPWITAWSRFTYKKLHHEPIDESAKEWTISGLGPLSGANSALPWIIFERDREEFERRFPELKIEKLSLLMPFRYLVSGGISLRNLMFGWSFGLWSGFEKLLTPWMPRLAMFANIVLVRK